MIVEEKIRRLEKLIDDENEHVFSLVNQAVI